MEILKNVKAFKNSEAHGDGCTAGPYAVYLLLQLIIIFALEKAMADIQEHETGEYGHSHCFFQQEELSPS